MNSDYEDGYDKGYDDGYNSSESELVEERKQLKAEIAEERLISEQYRGEITELLAELESMQPVFDAVELMVLSKESGIYQGYDINVHSAYLKYKEVGDE